MREAGLPPQVEDSHGERGFTTGATGVVRAVYPDRWRVDIEDAQGSLLTEALVIGPYLPELHQDGDAPSHVGYFHVRGMPEVVCWPMPHRRLLGPHDLPTGQQGQDQPERRYFHLHGYIFRHGDITLRVTQDNRFVMESEAGDYLLYDAATREMHLHAPVVFVGTDEANNRIEYTQDESIRAFQPLILLGTETGDRIEYQQGDHVHVASPQVLIGQTPAPDTDGMTYIANVLIHLVSQLIQLTATTEIDLQAPSINLGTGTFPHAMVLGDVLQTYINAVVKPIFDAHVHSGVTTGSGTSAAPTTTFPLMPNTALSTVARSSG